MGLDTENIKKRLSQLELDVKQMNQMIDENLDINETTLDSTHEDDHDSNDELDISNVDDIGRHEKGDNDIPQLEDNGNKKSDVIENKYKNIHIEHVNETDKDDMKNSISDQRYLQEEILEAIDNTQKSFIDNAQIGSIDDGKINNLTVDNETLTDDQDTIKGVVSEEKDDQRKEMVPVADRTSVGQQQIQELDSMPDTTSTIFSDSNNDNDKMQVNVQTKSLIENESFITDPLISDQETVQDNNEENTNAKKNDSHNNTEIQEDLSNSNQKYEEKNADEPDINENTHNISRDDNSTTPLEQIEQHPVVTDKQYTLGKMEKEQNVDKQEMTDFQPINIQQTEDITSINKPQEKEQLTENNDNEKSKPRATISEGKNKDEWEDTKKENTHEKNEIINKMENISTDDTISTRQSSTVRYDLSLNEDKIILPKHTNGKDIKIIISDNNISNISASTTFKNENIEDKSSSPTITIEKRKTTNPFRVISVSSPTSASSSRVNSSSSNHASNSGGKQPFSQKDNNSNVNIDDNIMRLQNRHEYLMEKCTKLEKEIKYLRQMENQGSLTLEDGKKLNRAIDKLQEYLDCKTKERYEIGVLLSRHLRRQINRGENGEFWIGRK